MMKSWADHCSSDEDTDDNYSVDSVESEVKEEAQSLDEAFEEKAQINEPTPQARTYDFPSQPPFTAFVGNLSFHIKEPSQLQQALADVVFERLGERVNVLGGRISFDRNSQKHRGFGYVELETLDELKIVMKLNDDDGAMLAGRKIQVDTANHQTNQRNNNNYNNRRGGGRGDNNNNNNNNNRGSFQRAPNEKIDGSKFRGGKYNNQNSFRNKNNNNNKDTKDEAPRQRPSLKLAPRSKPVDERRSSSSDIFGGAKARDEQAWEKQKLGAAEDKKKILKKPDNNNNNNNNNNNKSQGGRSGGRGGNKGGRGGNRNNGGRGNDNNNNNNNNNKKNNNRRNSQNEKKKEEKPAPKPAATKPADPPPPAEKAAPKNKFALLMDDSDSD